MDYSVSWNPGMKLEVLEQIAIERAYVFFRKNKTATANSLGISIRTLDNKLEKYSELASLENIQNEERKQDRENQLARARSGYTPQAVEGSGSGLRVESSSNFSAQQSLSVSERLEVQELLPRQAPSSGSNRRR